MSFKVATELDAAGNAKVDETLSKVVSSVGVVVVGVVVGGGVVVLISVGVGVRFVVDAEVVNKNWKKSKRFFSWLGKLMSLCGVVAFDQMTNTQTVL